MEGQQKQGNNVTSEGGNYVDCMKSRGWLFGWSTVVAKWATLAMVGSQYSIGLMVGNWVGGFGFVARR